MWKNSVKAKQWLNKRYGNSALGKSTIIDWYAEFKRDRTNTDDAESSGRTKSAVVPENIPEVHKIVLGDCKLKLREIADTLKILEGSVFTILYESLGMRKSKATKNSTVSWQGNGIRILGRAWYFVHRLSWEK